MQTARIDTENEDQVWSALIGVIKWNTDRRVMKSIFSKNREY